MGTATRRARLGRVGAGVSGAALLRAVDHAQDDLEPLVEHVDADERDRDPQRRQRLRDQQRARRDQRRGAREPQPGRVRFGRRDSPRRAQWALDLDRPDQRRGGGGDDRARAGQNPAEGAQVTEVRVPYAGGGAVDQQRARHRVGDHDRQPRGGDADPELRARAPAVGREDERGDGGGEGQRPQHPGEHLQPLAGAHDVGGDGAEVALEQDDALAGVDVVGELRVELLERGRHDGADVGKRERQRVAVAGEDRAVGVEHRAAEQAPERAAADDAGDRGGDQRPRRDQVGVVAQDHLVGHAVADRGADGRLCQRCRGAIGELLGVEQRQPGVRGDRGSDEQHRRDHHQHRRAPAGHAAGPYPRGSESNRFAPMTPTEIVERVIALGHERLAEALELDASRRRVDRRQRPSAAARPRGDRRVRRRGARPPRDGGARGAADEHDPARRRRARLRRSSGSRTPAAAASSRCGRWPGSTRSAATASRRSRCTARGSRPATAAGIAPGTPPTRRFRNWQLAIGLGRRPAAGLT